jgi:multidrug efflux pump subunit AcrB
VYIKDVAQVHMGYAEQTNIVRENGKRSALLTVLKNGDTSTLDIVSQTKAMIPRLTAGLGNLKITPLFDQSIFVRSSINEVVREATIAALLTGLMILLFLGSWRSTSDRLHFDSAVDRDFADHPERRWARRST